MSLEISLLTGAVAAVGGVFSLLKPLISSFFEDRKTKSLLVTISTKDGDKRTFELHGEVGKEVIEKLLRDLAEVKNGDQASSKK